MSTLERRIRKLRLLPVITITAALLPAAVAATTGPTNIQVDQVTANAVADLWIPSVQELDVPPECSGANQVDCPDGVPESPASDVRVTRVTLAASVRSPTGLTVSSDMLVETLAPLAVSFSGVPCELWIDSRNGTRPAVQVASPADLQTSPLLAYNYLQQGDTTVAGLEDDDVWLTGSLVCSALNSERAFALDLLDSLISGLLESHGPLCGVPAPQLVATCPWLTGPSSVGFADRAVGDSSGPQQVQLYNAGPGYPYVIGIGQISVEGPDASDFSLAADNCSGSSLWTGGCAIDVIFTPSAGGPRTASLVVPSSWPGSPLTIPLTGSGIAAPPAEADVSVGITAAVGSGKAKGRITYMITVSNAGPSSADTVILDDTLGGQSTFVSVNTSSGSCTGPAIGASGVVSCSLGTIASGANVQVHVTVNVTARKASLTNTATVGSSTSDPDASDNTASVTTQVK